MTRLSEFNDMDGRAAAALLWPCLGVDRWVGAVVRDRPYASVDDLLSVARSAAHPLTAQEVEAALAHHPRIGDRAEGTSSEAGLSRSEQAGLVLGDDVQRRLAEGNRAYQRRFGRVFLIRAAGRSSEEILAVLETRLGHDDATEDEVVAEQLRQIAVLRLAAAVSP